MSGAPPTGRRHPAGGPAPVGAEPQAAAGARRGGARATQDGLLADRVLASPVYHHFADGAPGLTELAILGHALRLVRGMEASASRTRPDRPVSSTLPPPAMAFASSPHRAGVGGDPPGPLRRMASELARMISDPERCGIVVVTQAEEMPVEEAWRCVRSLRGRVTRSRGVDRQRSVPRSSARARFGAKERRARLALAPPPAAQRARDGPSPAPWPAPASSCRSSPSTADRRLTEMLQRCRERAIGEP